MTNSMLKYHPKDGLEFSGMGWAAQHFRGAFPSQVWYFNPWTGGRRFPGDVHSDPFGLLIAPSKAGLGFSSGGPTATPPRRDQEHGKEAVANQAQGALGTQIGGDHYKKLKIQPMEYSMVNKLDACQHTIIKYVTRFRDKGGVQDLNKARHVLDMLIEFEAKNGK